VAGIWFFILVRDGNLPVPMFIQNLFPSIFSEEAHGEYEGEEDEAAECNDDSSYAANADDTFESFDVGASSESFREEEAAAGLGELSANYSGASLPPNFTVVWPNGNTSAAFRSTDAVAMSGATPNGDDFFFDGTVHINSAALQETMRFAMGSENGGIEILGGVDDVGAGYAADDSWGTGRNKAKLDQLFRYMATMDARDNAQGATTQRQKLQRKLLQRSAGAAAAAGGAEAEVAGSSTVCGNSRSRGNATGSAAEVEDVLQDSGKMEALLRELGEHGTTSKACGPSKRAKPKRSSAPRNSRGGGGGATSLKEPAKQQLVAGRHAADAEVAAEPEEDVLKATLHEDAVHPLPPAATEAQADTEAVEDFGGPEGPDFGIEIGFGTGQLSEGFKVVANRKARRKGRQRTSTAEGAEGLEAASELQGREAAAAEAASVILEPAKPRNATARGLNANPSAAASGSASGTAVRGAGASAAAASSVKLKPTRAPWATDEVSARASREAHTPCAWPCNSGADGQGDGHDKVVVSGENMSEDSIQAVTTAEAGVEDHAEASKAKKQVAECSPQGSQRDAEDSVETTLNPDPENDKEVHPAVPDGADRDISDAQAVQGEDGEWDDENDEDWEWQCPSGYRLEHYTCPRPMVCSSCGKMQAEGASMLRSEVSAWAACQECLNLAWEQPVEPNPPSTAEWSAEASQSAADVAPDTLDPLRMTPTEIAAWFKQHGAEDALRDCMKQVLAQVGQRSQTGAEAVHAE